jgi:branched-chain amino acid transport system substrate-binding protein
MLCVALSVATAVVAGCGNRLDDETLAAALGSSVTQSAAPAASLGQDAPTEQGAVQNVRAATADTTRSAPAAATEPTTGKTSAGQSSGAAADTSAAASAAAPEKVTRSGPRSTVVFGHIGTYRGLVGALEAGNKYALSAWVSMQNARGGLDGHPIKLIIGDDGGDPVTGLTVMKRMVESDKVIAFVGNFLVFGLDQYADYAASKGVPFIGGDAVGERWFTDPNLFPSIGSTTGALIAGLQYFVGQGATRLGMTYCIEVAKLCGYIADTIANSPVGKNLVVKEQVSLVAPSYTSQCLRMQSAKVEVAYLLMDTAAAARFVQNCASQNFKPKVMILGLDASPEFPTVAALGDTLVPSGTVALSETQIPAVAEYHAAMAKYAPGINDSGTAGLGWASGMVLGRAGAHLPDNPTAADFKANLWKMKNDDLGGYTTPLTFAKDHPAVVADCMFVWGVKDQKFWAPFGPKRRC